MRSRFIGGTLLLMATLGVSAVANTGDVTPTRQWAVVNLPEATRIGPAIVMGPVMFVHDDTKMARGEPCTSVYRFVPGQGPTEEIVAFHCTPNRRPIADEFKMTVRRDQQYGQRILTAYQFAGDSEIHGVPTR